jgi:hypothetical protein
MNNYEQDQLLSGEQDDAENYSNTKGSTGTSAIYFGDSKTETNNEPEPSKKRDHTKEDKALTSPPTDDLQSNIDGAASTDNRATTARKTFGDIELNKGLESQAMDEES